MRPETIAAQAETDTARAACDTAKAALEDALNPFSSDARRQSAAEIAERAAAEAREAKGRCMLGSGRHGRGGYWLPLTARAYDLWAISQAYAKDAARYAAAARAAADWKWSL